MSKVKQVSREMVSLCFVKSFLELFFGRKTVNSYLCGVNYQNIDYYEKVFIFHGYYHR